MVTRRRLIAGALSASLVPGLSAHAAKSFEIMRSPEEWKEILSPRAYWVLREHGTEQPWTSPLNNEVREGRYVCAGCAQPLFSSGAKYDSHTGWPSFWDAYQGSLGTQRDWSLIFPRMETHCSRCGGHIGHVFKDGPHPTGLRYCMNGLAMDFVPDWPDWNGERSDLRGV